MIMRIAFYYRKGNTTFGCMLPEEKERLHVFFAAEQKREAAKSLSRKLDRRLRLHEASDIMALSQ